tara:strand:+ start:5752 stop:6612 length:861 start_codon:yes stop_codon:yes gene_type:complete
MIIIRFIGGLGNQMFQYLLYDQLKSININVKADINDFKSYKLHNGFELEKVFEINLDKASNKEIKNLKDSSLQFLSRFRRKLLGKKKSHVYQNQMSLELIKKQRNLYLDGYWQSKKYINSSLSNPNKKFKFRLNPSKVNKDLINEINEFNSISIHVRRGDYLKLSDTFSKCTIGYYQTAISHMETNLKNCVFYIFSNDILWCKEKLIFNKSKFRFISHNSGINSYEDMRLMKMCKHNIIANSSFSWWAAVLNDNSKKVVISPKRWYVEKNMSDEIFIPNEWLKFDN